MRLLTLLVLLLATVAICSADDVENQNVDEPDGAEEAEEENWEDDGVTIVAADNFETFLDENEFVLVEFYAPWCSHCKSFAPEYAKLATHIEEKSSPLRVVKVDATKDAKYSEQYGVRGYPTLTLFRSGKPSEYWGVKDVSSIVNWILKKIGPAAIEIENVADAEAFIKSKDVVIIGFFKNSESEQAEQFLSAADSIDEHSFGITSNDDVYKKYDVKTDSIVLFKNFDEGNTVFEGEFTEKAIREFVAINAAPLIIGFNRNIGQSVFNVLHRHVLMFISKEQGHIEKYVEPANEVAKQFRGKVVFVAIDTDLNEYRNVLSFFNLNKDDTPAIRLVHFVNESNVKYKPKDADLSPESIRSFVQDGIDGKLKIDVISQRLPEDWDKTPVKTIVGSNFDDVVFDTSKDVFVAFYELGSDDSRELPPTFVELGEKYKDSETVIIAKFDSTANELDPRHPKIVSLPTLKLYKKGDNSVVNYAGKKTLEAFVKFIESGGDEVEYEDEDATEEVDDAAEEVGDATEEVNDATEEVEEDEDDYQYEEKDEL